jgi:hypothetical protein
MPPRSQNTLVNQALRIAVPLIGTLVLLIYRMVDARLEKLESVPPPDAALATLQTQNKSIEQRLERMEQQQGQVLETVLRIESRNH